MAILSFKRQRQSVAADDSEQAVEQPDSPEAEFGPDRAQDARIPAGPPVRDISARLDLVTSYSQPATDSKPVTESEPVTDSQSVIGQRGHVSESDLSLQTLPAFPSLEEDLTMDSNDNSPPAYPFAAAGTDINMIDKHHASANGSAPSGYSGTGNPVEMARQVAAAMQDLVRQANEQEVMRKELESRLSVYSDNMRAYESLKQTLRDVSPAGVNDDDLETLQRVLQALTQDPNHIMVLAAVAQQATKLLAVVNSFTQLHGALKQAPPR
jgi:hypothetical protein